PQKSAAQVCHGRVQWHDQRFDLQQLRALAAVDWTGGYMRRETFWNWGSLSCQLRDGRGLGFNLAAGVNETGFTENALWLDGRLIKVDMVKRKSTISTFIKRPVAGRPLNKSGYGGFPFRPLPTQPQLGHAFRRRHY